MAKMVEGRFFILISLAFAWGLSEASFFFIVPDVVISFIALEFGYRKGLLAVAASVLGAVLGGALIYAWSASDITSARAFFDQLPAIATSTIARAQADVGQSSLGLAMLKGSISGVPYKLYASEAAAAGVSLGTLLALTPIARLPRFLIAAILAATAKHIVPTRFQTHKLKVLGLFWLGFYALY